MTSFVSIAYATNETSEYFAQSKHLDATSEQNLLLLAYAKKTVLFEPYLLSKAD